ncbi:aldehyde dehydrogenase, dimeric NADP-preferring-like [Culicoides brevitarsis]|uniref:aldehyde dehydrogenase, dimeric NADP-preferring-like n=1 Tax=Culicoides brevitarsis TaxID=469753 RepID=UPI00307B21C1
MSTFEHVIAGLRAAFASGKTMDLAFRRKQLVALQRMYKECETEMITAVAKDLRKSKHEALLAEIMPTRNEVDEMISNLNEWAAPEKPSKTLVNMLDKMMIVNDPYGVVLVLGAWNYPLQLTLVPVQAAIAAGNCVVIKPSEHASHVAKFLADTIPKYLDNDCYQVICGGIPETTDLLKNKFDYIFYTGSTRVGQIIHAAANKHLTPVTLELGGKSPCFINSDADIAITARRVLWGKFMNCGQTCIAPDYILCNKETQEKFVKEAKKVISEWYGDDAKASPDLCRIINQTNFNRLQGLLKTGKGQIAIGGKTVADDLFIEPTIIENVQKSDAIMQEEIFGPILPIVNVRDAAEAISYIKEGEKPLALYVFTKDAKIQDLFITKVSAGGVCVNDTILHAAAPNLPFGGVGNSGIGAYHGKYSFDTFVHKKSVLIKDFNKIGEALASGRYPPYTESKTKRLLGLMRRREFGFSCKYLPHTVMFLLGVALTLFVKHFID